MTLFTNNLFEHILIEPAVRGGRKLYIVSGYATPAMAFHHLNTLRERSLNVSIELIIGMCALEGLGQSHHLGFNEIVEGNFKDNFKCSYLTTVPPVHSKVYAWLNDKKLIAGFAGSANYTQAAFGGRKREFMVPCNAEDCLDYFQSLISETIYCNHQDADKEIIIYNDRTFEYRQRMGRLTVDLLPEPATKAPIIEGLEHITISFFDTRGDLPKRSGLNWGQRPEYNREPNQAYIRIPIEIARTNFFPPRGEHFTVLTDDDRVLICTRAQDESKAIECPQDNSLIGMYFRNRLGLRSGQMITRADLIGYGRTDVDFYKIDDETYYMDFPPPTRNKPPPSRIVK